MSAWIETTWNIYAFTMPKGRTLMSAWIETIYIGSDFNVRIVALS